MIPARLTAIRSTWFDLLVHMGEYAHATRNIRLLMAQTSETQLLAQSFQLIETSLMRLIDHYAHFTQDAVAHEDEIIQLYEADRALREHIARGSSLLKTIGSVLATPSLNLATLFALAKEEMDRIDRTSYALEQAYLTLKSHYADTQGIITKHIQKTKKYRLPAGHQDTLVSLGVSLEIKYLN